MATLKSPLKVSDEMLAAMNVTRDFLAKRNIDKQALDAQAPSPGSKAPNFSANLLDENGAPSGEVAELHALLEKPVGLLFGSYTCPIFRGQLQRYEEIHQALKGRVNFLCVYILEAHPEDGWRVPHNWERDICFPTPSSLNERAKIAHLCRAEHGLTIPMAMDTMDNALMTCYAGSPERLYAIAANATITHRSSIGPYDMDDVEAWFEALTAAAL